VSERWQDVLPPVTRSSCQCSLRDRFPLKLCFSLRDDRPSFRDSISSRYLPRSVLSHRIHSVGSRHRAALLRLRCAELTIENGYRYFGVLTIENYSSATDFVPPGNGKGHGFYNAYTAYNPPQSVSITYWPLPALTIKMLRAPIPGVTLDAKVIQSRANPA
jgi:hypothetical protein